MKLRFARNSVRIRIRKTAMQQLEELGKVNEIVFFPNGQKLTYGLEISDNEQELSAYFQDSALTLRIPESIAESWINSGEISLTREQTLPSGETLSLLIEKDFPCRHKSPEENTDTFEELTS